MEKRNAGYINALHIYTLFSFAVVGPLLNVLSMHQTFFISHNTRLSDLLLLLCVFSVVLPGLLVLCAFLVCRIGRACGKGFHLAVIASLVFLASLPPLKSLMGLDKPGSWQLVSRDAAILLVGAAIAGVATVLYSRRGVFRTFVTLLSPGILVFPAMFLVNSRVTEILATDQPLPPPARVTNEKKHAPVIMIIFDEFNGMSLLDDQHDIDRSRFPNFARFAEQATWFRNSTTNDAQTIHAIPAQLTGRFPDHALRPSVADHPDNLFTLLAKTHQLRVMEQDTALCQYQWVIEQGEQKNPDLDSDAPQRLGRGRPAWQRFAQLAADAAVVYAHIVTPEEHSKFLPGIGAQWGRFVDLGFFDETLYGGDVRYFGRGGRFRQFIEHIKPSDQPTFYFIHNLLPHVPYEYMPSGRHYFQNGENKTTDTGMSIGMADLLERWQDDPTITLLFQQRYLLQLQFVDRLLAELVGHLQSVGLYDESLIVLTSDHGVSFEPGQSRRQIGMGNSHDILPTLFMIKAPNQREGKISDRNVESVDVLPTIIDILDIPVPWPIDGQSGLDEAVRARPLKRALCINEKFEYDGKFEQKYNSVARTLKYFPSSADPNALFRIGTRPEWIGRKMSEFDVVGESATVVSIDTAVRRHQGNGPAIAALVWGSVKPPTSTQTPVELAFSINGTIRAVTRTYRIKGWEDYWTVLLPEEAFESQRDKLEIFVVSSADGRFKLARANASR